MKHKKEFFGVLLSVLVCVFLVFLFVYATTVGSDITVTADLTVTSGARIGADNSAGHFTVKADDSLFVEGDIEVDGTAYFDGVVSIANQLILEKDISSVALRLNQANTYIYTDAGAGAYGSLEIISGEGKGSEISVWADVNENVSDGGWSPMLTMRARDTYTAIISDTGIGIWPDNDSDDFIEFKTSSNIPEITTSGSCDLKITPDGGDLYLDATVSVSDGFRVAGTSTFDGIVSVSESNGIVLGNAGTIIAGTGDYSVAIGYGNTASGLVAVAMGLTTTAGGTAAFAMGESTTANGDYSIAMGNSAAASGNYSVAMGFSTDASGLVATAMGNSTTASGESSVAMGSSTTASGESSVAMGSSTTASGIAAVAMGFSAVATGNVSFALGISALAGGDYSYAFGESASASATNSIAMGEDIEVSGANSFGIALNDQGGADLTQASTMAIMGGRVGIDDLTPSHTFTVEGDASVSEDFYVGGATIKGGTASPQGSVSNPSCTTGSIYIHAGATSIDEVIAWCETTNSWQWADL